MTKSYGIPKILYGEFFGKGYNEHPLFWLSPGESAEIPSNGTCLAEKEHTGRIYFCTWMGNESCKKVQRFCDYRDGEVAPEDLKAKRLEQMREIAYMQIGE